MPDWIAELEARLAEGKGGYHDEHVFQDLIEALLGQGKVESAYQASQEALLQHPFSIELMCSQAAILLELNRHADALVLLDHAGSISPGEFDVALLRVEALIEIGRSDEAATQLAPFLEPGRSFSDQADAWYFMAMIEEDRENWQAMHRCLEKAVRHNLYFQEALERLWLSTEMLGNYTESAAFYEELLEEDAYAWQIWYNLGHAMACLERYEEAAEAFDFACTINEDFGHAYRDLGEMYLQTNAYALARDAFLTALEKTDRRDPDLLVRLGDAYEKNEQGDLAMASFQEALEQYDRHDEAMFRIGCRYILASDWSQAIFHLETAIGVNREREEYYVALAEAYFQSGLTDQAEMCLNRALELAPEQSGYWLQYAAFLLRNDSLEEALEVLESALDQQTTPQLDYARIACLFKLGKRQEACQSLCLQLAEYFEEHATLFELVPELSVDPDVISLVRAFRTED